MRDGARNNEAREREHERRIEREKIETTDGWAVASPRRRLTAAHTFVCSTSIVFVNNVTKIYTRNAFLRLLLSALNARSARTFVVRVFVLTSAALRGASALLLLHVNFVHAALFDVFAFHVNANLRASR